ncbi:PQQ-dependent sugar dehydrogenase [Microvirga sp. STR05]|uniref:PQQ-dependent sugar dehydrogenase n=1 Tax=Hymenobacter duratus TaxID=2771356 RepID=A0ABR8JG80_9BACT|nr:PQQ-dependent sugar dehydrogenase [Hymenobacter duratus]MBD2715867.1 PQQ-dependent sugar dehydrogenase [Hymenobacter duratus]MBR7950778.1 PQQ-dependent sugar dehydrogenase [Microvirga sp. STR05]
MTTRHFLPVLLLAPVLLAAFAPARPTAAPDANLSKIKLPAGFTISYFAQGVKSARELAVGPDGTVYVGTKDDKVYALPDRNKDGRADEVVTVATGLNAPNGVAVRNGALYVAEINRILRYDNIATRLRQKPKPAVVYDKLPNKDWHGYRYIAFGPDGKLYVPVGAPCNSCLPEEPIYGTINRLNADGTGLEVFAQGVRNTVGFDWSPQDKALWFTDNGRDMLGDNLPADELNRAANAGLHFGFPYFFAGDVPDPQLSKGRSADTYQKPARKLGPHVAALGMKFYTGKQFPAQYRNQILIPEHGSWNRSSKIGYRIMLVKLDATGKQATSYEPFAEGWLQGQKPWGRPVCLLVLPDGSLLVSDDQNDAVYRISYKG